MVPPHLWGRMGATVLQDGALPSPDEEITVPPWLTVGWSPLDGSPSVPSRNRRIPVVRVSGHQAGSNPF